ERPTASSVAGAIRWAVGGSNRPTSSFVTCGSSVRVPGGMRSTATRCWHCAVPSITGPSIRCLRVINSGYGKRKNHRMLPCRSLPRSVLQDEAVRLQIPSLLQQADPVFFPIASHGHQLFSEIPTIEQEDTKRDLVLH